jgi:hypothetical protein
MADSSLKFHLPQPILGVNIPLRHKQIGGVLGIDVWNAPAVT